MPCCAVPGAVDSAFREIHSSFASMRHGRSRARLRLLELGKRFAEGPGKVDGTWPCSRSVGLLAKYTGCMANGAASCLTQSIVLCRPLSQGEKSMREGPFWAALPCSGRHSGAMTGSSFEGFQWASVQRLGSITIDRPPYMLSHAWRVLLTLHYTEPRAPRRIPAIRPLVSPLANGHALPGHFCVTVGLEALCQRDRGALVGWPGIARIVGFYIVPRYCRRGDNCACSRSLRLGGNRHSERLESWQPLKLAQNISGDRFPHKVDRTEQGRRVALVALVV